VVDRKEGEERGLAGKRGKASHYSELPERQGYQPGTTDWGAGRGDGEELTEEKQAYLRSGGTQEGNKGLCKRGTHKS